MNALKAEDDDHFVELVAAIETELVSGNTSLAGLDEQLSEAPTELLPRLENAKKCLLLLEEVWPHPKSLVHEGATTVGRFQILRRLGQGGFGIVYLAHDPKLGRSIALKIQRPEAILSATLRDRFLREAKAAARLRHPNIAAVYEVSQEGLQFWIASEYCDGDSLSGWLQAKHAVVSPLAAATFMAALADALEYSHRQGVLHRDVKPSNVLLQRVQEANSMAPETVGEISGYTPKLIDFGLAKLLEGARDETRSGALVGTPAYMAPEQANGQVHRIGPATDVYALGTILYEVLTGRPVFQGGSDADTLRKIVADEVVSPRQLRRDVPRDLEAICLKCLQKKPQDRYLSAGHMAADLRRFVQGQPTLARPLSSAQRLLHWARRRPALAGLLAVSTVASLTLVAMATLYIVQLQRAQQTADALRGEAEASAETAGLYMYASQMRYAYESVQQGEVQEVASILDRYKSGERLANLRGFEWHYLKRKLDDSRLTLSGHRGEVYCVAFSPNRHVLASGSEDGHIKLWDPTSGQELATLAGHKSCVNDVKYSPDGQMLASASCDHTIKLWQATTHELLATLEGHREQVHSINFSSDGKLLASGGKENFVLVWDLAAKTVFKKLDLQPLTEVNSLVWQPDSRKLLLAGNHVISWDLDSDQAEVAWQLPAAQIVAAPNNEELAIAQKGGGILVVRPPHEENRVPVQELHGHLSGSVVSLSFSGDGRWLASGGNDGTVRIWGRGQEPCRQILAGHRGRVQGVVFAPGDGLLASAGFDGTIKLWPGDTFDTLPRAQASCLIPATVNDGSAMIAISPNLRYVACPSRLDEVQWFDLTADSRIGPSGAIATPDVTHGLNFLEGEATRLFGVPRATGQVSIYDVGQREFEDHFPIPANLPRDPSDSAGPAGTPPVMALSRDGRHLICSDPRNVTIRDTKTNELWCQLTCNANNNAPVFTASFPRLRFSPNGNTVIVTTAGEPGYVVDLASKTYARREMTGLCAVANDAELLANSLGPTVIAIVDPRGGREVHLRHNSAVVFAIFSPDALTFATGTNDGFVCLWNVATGTEVARLETRAGPIHRLRFSPDSRKLAAVAFQPEEATGEGTRGTLRAFVWEGSNER